MCVSRKSEMEPRERDSDREKARARECAHKLQAKLMQGRRVPRLGDTADAGGAMLQAISRERACLSRAGRTRPEKPVRDPRPALPRRSTPRHPIAIASTAKPPDPMLTVRADTLAGGSECLLSPWPAVPSPPVLAWEEASRHESFVPMTVSLRASRRSF